MSITHTVGRAIPAQASSARRRLPFPLALTALSLLAVGVLTGLLIGNRLLTAQLAIYGEANMAASSVVLDLMDDFFTPLALAITAALVLTLMTVGAWLLAGIRSTVLRRSAMAVLVGLVVLGAMWFGLGRKARASGTIPQLMTPTPVVSTP